VHIYSLLRLSSCLSSSRLFVIIQSLMGVKAGLVSAVLLSTAWLARGLVSPNKTVKVLDIGKVVLFGIFQSLIIAHPGFHTHRHSITKQEKQCTGTENGVVANG
jgi:hypothetical protein